VLKLKVNKTGVDPDTGEPVYCMKVDGRVARENLTLDQVIEAISRQDEAGLVKEAEK